MHVTRKEASLGAAAVAPAAWWALGEASRRDSRVRAGGLSTMNTPGAGQGVVWAWSPDRKSGTLQGSVPARGASPHVSVQPENSGCAQQEMRVRLRVRLLLGSVLLCFLCDCRCYR